MAMYVYVDKGRTQELYATDAYKKDKATRFYCPNPDCDAHMFICGLDGSSSAYFRATYKEHTHIDNCYFGSTNSFKSVEHDEESFDFKNAMESMLTPTKPTKKTPPSSHKLGNPNKTPLRTIRQIYDMCKTYKSSDTYNNITIGQMLLDDRSLYMYHKGIFGYRLIEAKVKAGYFYDSKTQTITLCGPIKDLRYKLLLKINDDKLFTMVRDKLFSNRENTVLISGNWQPTKVFNMFCTDISSKKQFHVIIR